MTHINDVLKEFYKGVRNVTGLAGKSRTFVEAVMLNPSLLAAADAVIGPNCADYSLNVAQLMVREPGAVRQWIHRDQEVWSFLPTPHEEIEVSCVLALADFTSTNGATVAVPGSHRWDPERRPEESEVVTAEMPAGAGIVYLGSTLHAGGTNVSEQGRPGVHLSYVAGWLRPEENNCLAIAPDIARNLPRRAQQLIGYGIHDAAAVGGGYLGCVDLQDPVDLLAAGQL
jgi:ectoine hydroxylase-related dioxygenase (phytanoyl-CoA dioxygenase family)